MTPSDPPKDGRSLRAMLCELAARHSGMTLSPLEGGKRWLLSVIDIAGVKVTAQLHYEGPDLTRVVRAAWHRAPGGLVP